MRGGGRLAIKIWKAIGKEILYKVNRSAQMILDALPEARAEGMTRAEVAKEIGRSTRFVKEYSELLSEAGLISMDKGEGHRAWIMWKVRLPTFDEIEIVRNGAQNGDILGKNGKGENQKQKRKQNAFSKSPSFPKRTPKRAPIG